MRFLQSLPVHEVTSERPALQSRFKHVCFSHHNIESQGDYPRSFMASVYGVQFTVRTRDGGPPLANVRESAESWVRSWYRYWHRTAIDFPQVGVTAEPIPGHRLRADVFTAANSEALWQLDWDYPDLLDPTMEIQVDCSLTTLGDAAEFALGVSRESTAYRVAPSPFEIKPPHLVKQLVRDYACSSAGRPTESVPRSLDAESIPTFVAKELQDRSRTLPVLLVTRPNLGVDYLVSPATLGDELSGLAHVFVIPDRTGTYVLSDLVKRDLSCFNGAARIYWPGFELTDNPRKHPLFLPEGFQRIRAEGKTPESVIFARVASVSALRFGPAPEATRIQRQVFEEEERRIDAELKELRERLGQEGLSRDALLERLHALELLDRERSKKIRLLEGENLRLKQARAQAGTEPHTEDDRGGGEISGTGPSEPEIASVADALSRARSEFSDYLVVLRSAVDSAAVSRSRHAQEAYRALVAIREVAHDYFLGIDTKIGLGETMEKAFRRRGFHFAVKDSKTTQGKFGNQRTFVYDGGSRLFERHLTIGGGDRQDTIQIYFLADPAKRKFVIGYCGMHLEGVRGAS